MRHNTAGIWVALALVAGALPAYGDNIYNGFASTTGLTLNGSATTTTTSDGVVLRLTPAQGGEAGSAFSTAKVDTGTFTSIFSFRITNPGGPLFDDNTSDGADGFVFAVENEANNVGSEGQGIGYQGISPSIGIAYDTWKNPEHNDPSQNYVGIDLDGSVDHNASNGPTTNITSDEMGDGNRWWSWVFYNNNTLEVYLLESDSTTVPALPANPILSYNINLTSQLGAAQAFAGFTSGTGSDYEDHDILYWQYTPSDLRTVPEPAAASLVAMGILAHLVRRRRGAHAKSCKPEAANP